MFFLDASKVFDRVNHYVLFDKLIKRGVPLYVVRILIVWYTTQTMYVRWNNVISSGFGVTNGVRQGGILSPYLFCVYMDDLSNKLNGIKVGCTIGATLINHLNVCGRFSTSISFSYGFIFIVVSVLSIRHRT